MSIIDAHLDGTPWHHDLYEVVIILAAGHLRQRARALATAEIQPDDDGTRKRCRTCKEWRTLDHFWKHPTTSDGLDGRCKDCKRVYDAKRAQRMREAAGGRG